MPATLDTLAQLGNAVGGFATLVAVGFAMYELRRWRLNARDEKRSQAASRALMALTAAHDAITNWLTIVHDGLEVEDPEAGFVSLARQVEAVDNKLQLRVDPYLRELHLASAEAYVHLDSAHANILSELQCLTTDTREYLDSFLTELVQAPEGTELDVIHRMRSTLTEARSLANRLLVQGAAALQPIARLAA